MKKVCSLATIIKLLLLMVMNGILCGTHGSRKMTLSLSPSPSLCPPSFLLLNQGSPIPGPVQNWAVGETGKCMCIKLHLCEQRALVLVCEAPFVWMELCMRAPSTHASGACAWPQVTSAHASGSTCCSCNCMKLHLCKWRMCIPTIHINGAVRACVLLSHAPPLCWAGPPS